MELWMEDQPGGLDWALDSEVNRVEFARQLELDCRILKRDKSAFQLESTSVSSVKQRRCFAPNVHGLGTESGRSEFPSGATSGSGRGRSTYERINSS